MNAEFEYIKQFRNKYSIQEIEESIRSISAKFADASIFNKNEVEEYENLKILLDLLIDIDKIIFDFNTLQELKSQQLLDQQDLEYQENSLYSRIYNIKKSIEQNFSNKLEFDDNEAIIEIRPGVGGEEASLFAEEIARAYTLYMTRKDIKFDILSRDYSDNVTLKEVIIHVKALHAYSKFRFESGIFRVQRIPKTESNGRIHTSTIVFTVLPFLKSEYNDININIEDIRIDTFRSSGAGGQSVNTTDSAVRIKHLPTGIIVTCQNCKSQHQNKEYALRILKSKLLQQQQEENLIKQRSLKDQITLNSDRSFKTRTFNFPQSRITDHRINKSWFNINEFMEGNIDQIIDDTNNSLRNKLSL